ncbi:MAG: replication initiation protein, partial [Sterolibacterium sp.]|nr:replication initiation protein [Sterolibacterium sp.]
YVTQLAGWARTGAWTSATGVDYRAGLAMASRYAHRLHEMIALRAGRDKQIERFTVEDLRARLGVQTGKLGTWTAFKQRALDTAIEEVNQSSRFVVSYRITKRERRATTEIELAWEVKPEQEETKREQAAHSVARKGRRAEVKERLAFPASGSIEFDEYWKALKRAAGCNMDNAMIAEKFRAWCAGKSLALDARNIEQAFTAFCAKVGRI